MGGSIIALETIVKSCCRANAWAGVSRFCWRHRAHAFARLRRSTDNTAEIYIGGLHKGWDLGPNGWDSRPAAFNHCQSVRTEHRYGAFVLSSSHGIHLPFFDNIPTSPRSPVLREYLRGHIAEIISVTYYIRYTLLSPPKDKKNAILVKTNHYFFYSSKILFMTCRVWGYNPFSIKSSIHDFSSY